MKLTVSVAMCTYNGARFLQEQLDSLANQTFLPTELVIFDDISSDKTLEIIADFERNAPFPVKLFVNKERLFHQRNFIKAATACSSELIAFCDQDDIWMLDKLSIMTSYFTDTDVMVVAHQARLINQIGEEIAPRLPDADFAPIYERLNCQPWNFPRGFSQVFRSQINKFADFHIMTEGFSCKDPYLPHDLWTQLIGNALGKVLFIDIPLANYRQHENNLFGIMQNTSYNKIDPQIYNLDSERKSLIISKIFESAREKIEFKHLSNKLLEAERYWTWLSKSFKTIYYIYNRKFLMDRIGPLIYLLWLGVHKSKKQRPFSYRAISKDALSINTNNNYNI